MSTFQQPNFAMSYGRTGDRPVAERRFNKVKDTHRSAFVKKGEDWKTIRPTRPVDEKQDEQQDWASKCVLHHDSLPEKPSADWKEVIASNTRIVEGKLAEAGMKKRDIIMAKQTVRTTMPHDYMGQRRDLLPEEEWFTTWPQNHQYLQQTNSSKVSPAGGEQWMHHERSRWNCHEYPFDRYEPQGPPFPPTPSPRPNPQTNGLTHLDEEEIKLIQTFVNRVDPSEEQAGRSHAQKPPLLSDKLRLAREQLERTGATEDQMDGTKPQFGLANLQKKIVVTDRELLAREENDRAIPAVTATPPTSNAQSQGPTDTGIYPRLTSNPEPKTFLEIQQTVAERDHLALEEWKKLYYPPHPLNANPGARGRDNKSVGMNSDHPSHLPIPSAHREALKSSVLDKRSREEERRREIERLLKCNYAAYSSLSKANPPATKVQSRASWSTGLNPEATSYTPPTAGIEVTTSRIPVKINVNLPAPSALPHLQHLTRHAGPSPKTTLEQTERHGKDSNSSRVSKPLSVATWDRVVASEGKPLVPAAQPAPVTICDRVISGEGKSPAPAVAAREEEKGENDVEEEKTDYGEEAVYKEWIILDEFEVTQSTNLGAEAGAAKSTGNGEWIFI